VLIPAVDFHSRVDKDQLSNSLLIIDTAMKTMTDLVIVKAKFMIFRDLVFPKVRHVQ